MTKTKRKTAAKPHTVSASRPRVLVMELSGGDCAYGVHLAGGDVITISPRDIGGVETAFKEGAVDGLLLTGGGDVDPRLYGQQTHRRTYGVNEDRDRAEFRALRLARGHSVPVLGICRGSQVMTVEAGGTLYQDLPSRLRDSSHRHANSELAVRFEPGSLAGQAVGQPKATTRHLHHQSVRKVGIGYRASAWHGDGTIEAVESTDGIWRVGAQFHPEFAVYDAPERGLFRALVVHAALLAGLPVPSPRKPRLAPRKPAKSTKRPIPATWVRPTLRDDDDEWDLTDVVDTVLEREARRALPAATRKQKYPVTSFWRCFRCSIEFDHRDDYVDHMFVLHAVALYDHDEAGGGTTGGAAPMEVKVTTL